MKCYESSFAVALDGTAESLENAKKLSHDTVIANTGDTRRSGVRWTLWGTTNAVENLTAQGIELDTEVRELCRVFPHRTLVMAHCGGRSLMSSHDDRVVHDLRDTFARQLFIAEMGHTGMTWDEYARDNDDTEYHRQAGRFLEGWWEPSKPFVVMDLANDEMWLERRADVETPVAPAVGEHP